MNINAARARVPTRDPARNGGGSSFHWCTAELRSSGFAAKNDAPISSQLRTVQRAEALGFEGILLPTGPSNLDPWTIATAAAALTSRIKLIVAIYADQVIPTWMAKQVQTFLSLFPNRLAMNLVAGNMVTSSKMANLSSDHDQRYARLLEYIDEVKRLLEEAGAAQPILMSSGSSLGATRLRQALSSTHFFLALPPPQMEAKLSAMSSELPCERIGLGIRMHVIIDDDVDHAWKLAEQLWAGVTPHLYRDRKLAAATTDSVGGADLGQFSGLAADKPNGARALEVFPNVWAGPSFMRGGPGLAFVGTPSDLMTLVAKYESIGIDHFILSGIEGLPMAEKLAEIVKISTQQHRAFE